MGMQVGMHSQLVLTPPKALSQIATLISSSSSYSPLCFLGKYNTKLQQNRGFGIGKNVCVDVRTRRDVVVASSSSSSSSNLGFLENWKPEKSAKSPLLSDIIWPAAGAFAAMAVLGKMDQMLASKGVSITIAPLGAVCAVLFATPSSPGARKYNMFIAQIGCAAIGVLAFSILGPGWLARSAGLAAAIAFMITTGSIHPPAASLPLLFIDVAKMHHLNFWYALFLGLPSKDGRLAIFKVHARNKLFHSEEEKVMLLQQVAEHTEDFIGAELQNTLKILASKITPIITLIVMLIHTHSMKLYCCCICILEIKC